MRQQSDLTTRPGSTDALCEREKKAGDNVAPRHPKDAYHVAKAHEEYEKFLAAGRRIDERRLRRARKRKYWLGWFIAAMWLWIAVCAVIWIVRIG